MKEDEIPQCVRVVETHVTNDPSPIQFGAGETVAVGHHDQVYTHYVWGTDQAGRSGWVPLSYLEVGPDGRTARALRDYDSTELTVGRNELLDVLEEAGGWYLCRRQDGASGWVPATSVEPAGQA